MSCVTGQRSFNGVRRAATALRTERWAAMALNNGAGNRGGELQRSSRRWRRSYRNGGEVTMVERCAIGVLRFWSSDYVRGVSNSIGNIAECTPQFSIRLYFNPLICKFSVMPLLCHNFLYWTEYAHSVTQWTWSYHHLHHAHSHYSFNALFKSISPFLPLIR